VLSADEKVPLTDRGAHTDAAALPPITLTLLILVPIVIGVGLILIRRWDVRATLLTIMWLGWAASAVLARRTLPVARTAFWGVAAALIAVMIALLASCALNFAVYLGLGSRMLRHGRQ
jgi:hypothetical protein